MASIETYAEVLALVQPLLNDSAAEVWTSSKVLPFANSAYSTLNRRLVGCGATFATEIATFAVGSGVATITTATTPTLPTDMIVPYELFEIVAGAGADTYRPMRKVDVLPIRPSGSFLQEWVFEAGALRWVAPTQNLTVRVRYEKGLARLTGGSSSLVIPDVTDALAFATAVLAARSKGQRELAIDMKGLYDEAWQDLARQYAKSNQYTRSVRRRAYSNS